jgi:hypothetical protein
MRSHLKQANVEIDTEEGCLELLRRIKAEGGRTYYRSADYTNRLVISPSRKGSYWSLARTGTSPSLAQCVTKILKIESRDDWLAIKKRYDL